MRCDGCGYDYDRAVRQDLPDRIRSGAADHSHRLTENPVAALRAHPVEGMWSALEYGCHVRDVLLVQYQRILRADAEDEPVFEPMRRDERVVEDRYNEQDPSTVADELDAAAERLASLLEALDERGWRRTGLYSYPEPQLRDVEWIARHTIHELEHHRGDVDRLLLLTT